MKIDYCYHTHTKRCGHAQGEDEDYVLSAIKSGIKTIGFTDHVFLPFHPQPGIRGNYELLDDYLISLRNLKEKYKDDINVLIGFEAEFFPEYLEYYKKLLNDNIVDYLILGQHLYMENGLLKWNFTQNDGPGEIENYANWLIKGMESGIFTYVAHPDVFVLGISEFKENAVKISHLICQKAVELGIPLEFNLGGHRRPIKPNGGLRYPNEEFWQIAKQYPLKIIIGQDAHNPSTVFVEEEINFALSKLKELGLEVLTTLDGYFINKVN
jgi:histidinol-phosphatase (PHP family)